MIAFSEISFCVFKEQGHKKRDRRGEHQQLTTLVFIQCSNSILKSLLRLSIEFLN